MSTQAARSILFTHSTPQQGFRLLELPPELVELVSSKEAPTLELKSPPPQSQSHTATHDKDNARDYINLCTPTRTYRVRQVQSSNSLHVIRTGDPRGVRHGDMSIVGEQQDDDDDDDDDGLGTVDTMTSIAKCGSTLELHTPPEGFSAMPFLMKMLRVYDRELSDGNSDVDMADDTGTETDADVAATINAFFADIPISRAQCEQAWTELCAFVSRNSCWRPSPKCKVDVWKRVVEGSVLQGINLEKQFLVNDLWKSVLDDEDDDNGGGPFPRGLFEAVVRRVCESEPGSTVKWTNIDKPRCIQWVGETYLQAMAPTSRLAIGRSEFLNAWKDHLPESWRNEVAFSKLPDGSYTHPDPTTICFVNEGDRQKLKKNLSTDASAATTAKKSRNWHELFKNQRRR